MLPGFSGRGGKRVSKKRKAKRRAKGVSHATRPEHKARHPVHVTMPLKRGLPSLRNTDERLVLEGRMAHGKERFGFRLIEYSIQGDHLHLIVEAEDKTALSRGMQGLTIRIARGLNKLWNRTGKVFRDRYHAHVLETPWEVRNALVYVLQNVRKHGARWRKRVVDGCSSARWFTGWLGADMEAWPLGVLTPVCAARSWLLTVGWRVHGLIDPEELPRKAVEPMG